MEGAATFDRAWVRAGIAGLAVVVMVLLQSVAPALADRSTPCPHVAQGMDMDGHHGHGDAPDAGATHVDCAGTHCCPALGAIALPRPQIDEAPRAAYRPGEGPGPGAPPPGAHDRPPKTS